MIAGQQVKLIADRDEVITRTIVSVDNDVYFVCKSEEFEAAKMENREPICIGFRREYVLRETVLSRHDSRIPFVSSEYSCLYFYLIQQDGGNLAIKGA